MQFWEGDLMSNRSLKFVQGRIASGLCNGMENNQYESMQEINLMDVLNYYEHNITFDGNVCKRIILSATTDANLKGDIEIQVKYDPEAEFEYFTMETCICDGTFFFFYELMATVLNKVFGFGTYNKEKVPKDYNNNPFVYKLEYIIGNPIIAVEHNTKFATEDKPWLLDRFSVMLPIKMDFEKRDEVSGVICNA